jgi:phage gp36-like protein
MPYASQQHLIDLLGVTEVIQRTDRTNIPPSQIDAAVVAGALADADGLIDSYVGRRYAMPLAVVPPVLVRLAKVLAGYFLMGGAAGDSLRRDYEDALRTLRDIADGRMTLDVGADPAPATGDAVEMIDGVRLFSSDTLRGF